MVGNPSQHESEIVHKIYNAMAHFYPSLLEESQLTTKEKILKCGMDNGVYSRKHSVTALSYKKKKFNKLNNFTKKRGNMIL